MEQTRLKFFAALSAAPGTSSEKKREGRSLSRESGLCANSCDLCNLVCDFSFGDVLRAGGVRSGLVREDARGEARGRCFGEGRVPGEREGVALEVGMGREEGQTRWELRGAAHGPTVVDTCARPARFVNLQARERELCIVCEFFVYIPLQKRNSHDRVSGCPITATRHWTRTFTTPFTTCVLLTLVLASRYMCPHRAPRTG